MSAVPRRSFTALSNRRFAAFWALQTAAMMADNIEHVISYWVIFQKFHSSALGAFAVVSHWVPFLLLAPYSGALADRLDIRRMIQVGMLLFCGVSVGWGVMFMTDSTEQWKAMLLLVIHGLAGVIWIPASQVLIHRLAAPEELPSAVRLVATGRYAAFVLGPALGSSVLLAYCGPVAGIFINALIYLPMVIWLTTVPRASPRETLPRTQGVRGLADIVESLRVVARHPVLLAMTLLVGAAAFFVGNAYQAQMPGFAVDLGHDQPGYAYSLLLGADAAGGLTAGIILESRNLLPPSTRAAFILCMIWCIALVAFAQSGTYALAIPLLFVAGFVELGFNSMAQSLVQLHAPQAMRGRVIGIFSMAASGMRTFSGLSVGLLGAAIGIHNSLACSAAALLGVLLLIAARIRGRAAR